MANYRSASDLKKAILQFSGELTDGTSSYDTIALNYLNSVYHGLLAGGDVFGVDVSEAWSWARSKYPIVLQLKAPYETGTITLTASSSAFTLSTAPSISLEGYMLEIEGYAERYWIRYQSSTSGELDSLWLGDTGTYNIKAIKLDYDLVSDLIIIDDYNRYLPFAEGGSVVTATIDKGAYTPTELCAQLKTKMEAVSPNIRTYTWTFGSLTRKFTVAVSAGVVSIEGLSGTDPENNILATLGWDCEAVTGAASLTAPNVLNAIMRLVAPIRLDSFYNTSEAPQDAGKVYCLDLNAMDKNYPRSQMTSGTPDRFCILELRENGTMKIRFNKYVLEDTRCEVDYIALERDLKDNAYSVPKIPRAFREYPVYAATYKLLVDKSDNKAETFLNLAKAKLMALINHERSPIQLANKNFGKIIPRQSYREQK